MTFAVVAVLISTPLAAAQSAAPKRLPIAAPQAQTPATPATPAHSRPVPKIQSAVLTEGTILSSALGYLVASKRQPGMVQFVLEENLVGHARRTITLLPSDPTDEAKAMLVEPTPDTPWRFEVTGMVFDYMGHAYLLPASIIALKNPPLPPYLSRETPPELAAAAIAEAPRFPPLLDAYMELETAPTPLRDTSAAPMPHEKGLASVASGDDDFATQLEQRIKNAVRETSVAKRADPEIDRKMTLPSAIRVQDTRASVTRDPITGAWRAVLDAANIRGKAVAMELLPSRELERMERQQKQLPVGTPWLLSGEVVASGDRNFMLVTHARKMPNEHWMHP